MPTRRPAPGDTGMPGTGAGRSRQGLPNILRASCLIDVDDSGRTRFTGHSRLVPVGVPLDDDLLPLDEVTGQKIETTPIPAVTGQPKHSGSVALHAATEVPPCGR
jgi:hypothetical protein